MLPFYRELRALEPPPNYTEMFEREMEEASRKFDDLIDRHLEHRKQKRKERIRRSSEA
jgi:hypothetical protein